MQRKFTTTVAAGVAAGLMSAFAVASAPTASATLPAIMIYKVQYDSPGSDTGSNASLNAEYVVLKNTTRTNRVITGWTLKDKTGYTYKFPTFTLRAGAIVTIHTGKGTATTAHRYYNKTWYVWNNTGDTAYLRNASGRLMDTCAWTTRGAGYRYC